MTDILTGHLKGAPPSLRRLAPKAPPALVVLVGRLLDKDAGMRPSAAEAAAVLEDCATATEQARHVTAPPSRLRRNLLAALLLAGTGALLLHTLLPDRPAPAPDPVADLTVVDRVVAEAPDRLVIRHRTRSALQLSLDLVEHRAGGDVALPRLAVVLPPVPGPPGTVGGTNVELPTPILESVTATMILSGSPPRAFAVAPSPALATFLAPLEALSPERLVSLLEGLDELHQRFPTRADASSYDAARLALLARTGLDASWMTRARGLLPALARATTPFAPPRPLLVAALASLEALESAMPGTGGEVPPWGVGVSALRGVTTARSEVRSPARGWARKSLTAAAAPGDGGAVFENGTSVQLLPTDLVTKIALSDVSAAFQVIHAVQYPGPFPELIHGLDAHNLIERQGAVRAVYEFQVVNWDPMFALEVTIDGGEQRFLVNTWGRSPYREHSFPEEPHLVQVALDPAPLRRGPLTFRLRPRSLRRSVSAIAPRVSRPRLLVALPGAASGPWVPGP